MTYRWSYPGATGQDETFADQAEAEDWLRESWSDLLATGVEEVTLLDGTREVYGMSLRPPQD